MSIESDVFKRKKVCFDKLTAYGFKKEGLIYKYSKPFLDDFRADIEINEQGEVSGMVYDLTMDEEYINIRIESQVGSFVNQVREEYQKILEDISDHCFEKFFFITEQANRIAGSIRNLYHDEPEFAWENSPGFGIFRNPSNEKWYGLIMNIDKSRIDKNGSEEVEIINVKLDPEKIQRLLSNRGFYPAYHMNKKNWITILLDGTLSDNEVMECVKESHQYTEKGEEWIVPANPKFYDVISDVRDHDVITWKQSSNIQVGDSVYLYVGAPYSSILCKCQAQEVNIPYDYQDHNLSMEKVMKLKVLKRYQQDQYPFAKLNEYGVKAIRGPRSMPKKLSEVINQESKVVNQMKTDLLTIPNIGKNTKEDLLNLGITCVEDLKGKNPEKLYLEDCKVKKYQEDRCQLYVFRMAVYYAEHTTHEKEKLKWWYWKDKEYFNETIKEDQL